MGVTHPFEYRAHYNADGKVCHCPWGIAPGGEHLGSLKIVEASKLEWLENRKGMETPRNQKWLQYMRDTGLADERTDKLLPWLHREYNKERLLPGLYEGSPSEGLHYFKNNPDAFKRGGLAEPYTHYGIDGKPEHVTAENSGQFVDGADLHQLQEDLTEMQKRKQGIDLMQHSFPDVMNKVEDFRKWKGQQKRKDYGEVLHKFDNGWTVRRLQNDREHRDEGDLMHHCVGQPQYGYSENTEKGNKIYASLRDEMNQPHATMEITPNHWLDKETGEETMSQPGYGPDQGWIPQVGPNSHVEQFFGKNDSEPDEEHESMMNEWLQEHGHEGADPVDREADQVNVMAPYDIDSYNQIQGENGNYMEYADETDENGRPWGENTEFHFLPPEWNNIASDFLNYGWRSPHASEFMDSVRQSHHGQEFEEALRHKYNPSDPQHDQAIATWERMKAPYYHPYTGEFVEGYGPPTIEQFQNRLYNERHPSEQRIEPAVPISVMERTGPAYGPEISPIIPWQQNPNLAHLRLARSTKPLYVRWVYSPSKGVTVGSNADDHPAFVKYHQQLGGDINDTDLVHGYAYPIGNGWRVTDYEHQPLEDPYIVNQVVRGLNLGGTPQMSAEASWRPVSYDFDRLHFAIPFPLT